MIDAVYRLLTLNRNAAISAFNILKKLKGLDCVVTLPPDDSQPPKQYQPGRRGSIFGLEDLTDYDEWEEYTDTLLIFNLFYPYYNRNRLDCKKRKNLCGIIQIKSRNILQIQKMSG